MATKYKKQVKTLGFLRNTSYKSWVQLGDYIFVESVGKTYKCISLTSGGYSDDGAVTIITGEGLVFEMFNGVVEDTGSVLDLSNVNGANYNWSLASSATTYTTSNPVANGYARCLINTTSEPSVTGATRRTGATWVTGTNMEMVVETPDVTNIYYYFIEI